MISVGSGDVRERLGFGLGMEEAELEEGEARVYQNNGDGDSTVDPDISLSYIDEKLHNVLGHFQKDFEGGVSAENLGAKFGGYGSFLLTYQRSPSSSHAKSPAEVHNYDPSGSPAKDERQDTFAPSKSSLLGKAIPLGNLVEGICGKLPHAPEESPTSILQIMTSYPADLLLSPLPEDLVRLSDKVKLGGCYNTKLVDSMGRGNGFHSSGSTQKIPELKRLKLNSKDDNTSMGNQQNNGNKDNTASLLKENDIDVDGPCCDELFSNTLKLPLLLSSQHSIPGPAEDSTVKDLVKGEAHSVFTEKEKLDGDFGQETGRTEKLGKKIVSSEKFSESRKANIISNIAAFPQVDAPKAENSYALDHPESNVSVVRKVLTASETEPSKLFHKGSDDAEGLKPDLEKFSTGVEKNPWVVQTVGTEGVSIAKDVPIGNRYKDLSREVEDEKLRRSSGRLKDPPNIENRSLGGDHKTLKDICNGENAGKPFPSETDTRIDSHLASSLGNTLHPEVSTEKGENWIRCDNSQTQRLLPLGTDPSNLPHKWDCGMLNWLPGMNHCGIPETETTSALQALHSHAISIPASVSEGQRIAVINAAVTSAGVPSVDAKCTDQKQQTVAAQSGTINVEKKHGSAKAANSADLGGCTHSPDSQKKILATSENPSNLNSRNRFLSPDACGYQPMQLLSSANKFGKNEEEKISHTNCFGKDAILMIRTKRGSDVEGSGDYKRCKSEELQFDDGIRNSDNSGTPSKRGTADDDLLHSGKFSKGSYRKRKAKESHNSVIYTEPVSSSGLHPDSGDFVEELSDHKGKKSRVSKSGRKDSNGSETSDRTGRSRDTKDQHNGQYLSSSQAANNLKTDVISRQPAVAADLSSSKLARPHKNKEMGYECKGSPVGTISLSTLTCSNAVKVTSTRKKLNENDDFNDSGFMSVVSPRRISGGEDERRNGRPGVVEKDRKININDPVNDGYGSAKHYSDKCKVEDKTYADQCDNRGLIVKKSGNDLFSDSKDKTRASRSDSDKVTTKVSDTHDSLDHMHLHAEKSNHGGSKSEQKSGDPIKCEMVISKGDTARASSSKSSKGQSQEKLGHDRQDAVKIQDTKHDIRNERENVKLPKKSSGADAFGSGKSNSLPPLAQSHPLVVDAVNGGDTERAPNQRKRAENPSTQPARHPTPTSHKVRNVEAPSLHRDSSSHAANNALKEAKDLKHSADRLKNSGSTESIGLYFQAALKFLHGASILESGSNEATKHNELMHSMQIYSSTAKLCEFCACEYEKSKDMAAASLAYKCVEMAYMQVVYSSHNRASRDRNELQTALQITPSGGSPSSSASDVDNLTLQATTERASLARVVGSAKVSGNHAITSQNRSGLLRMLNFAQDATLAMEASRKSRIAFMAATSKLDETSHKKSISSLTKALDFNFQDVDSLLHLVRVAMEAISR